MMVSKIVDVIWRAQPLGWLKVNIDGVILRLLGLVECAVIC